ncbi:L-rhamnose-binding lectin CSL3-like [Ptychodera flava]|uniref:L-rhamnose-binding lectin CSL3-like n=1 Tax=Ptychodera flava TaxID=63121 RepID=UPI003969BCAE
MIATCFAFLLLQGVVEGGLIRRVRSSGQEKLGRVCEHKTVSLSCPRGKINVLSANYGRTENYVCGNYAVTDCRADNSLSLVSGQCDGKSTCDVRASNDVFGDPCWGTFKYLDVTYECQTSKCGAKQCVAEEKSGFVCEHDTLSLSCQSGEIEVVSANYGRTDSSVCGSYAVTDCVGANSLAIASDRCNGKRSCSVDASNDLFGDPCYGTFKYLEVSYKCKTSC